MVWATQIEHYGRNYGTVDVARNKIAPRALRSLVGTDSPVP